MQTNKPSFVVYHKINEKVFAASNTILGTETNNKERRHHLSPLRPLIKKRKITGPYLNQHHVGREAKNDQTIIVRPPSTENLIQHTCICPSPHNDSLVCYQQKRPPASLPHPPTAKKPNKRTGPYVTRTVLERRRKKFIKITIDPPPSTET